MAKKRQTEKRSAQSGHLFVYRFNRVTMTVPKINTYLVIAEQKRKHEIMNYRLNWWLMTKTKSKTAVTSGGSN